MPESREAGDAVDGCPGHGGSTKDLGLGCSVRLAGRDRVVQQVPVADRCLLQQWMVTFGDGRSVREVVDVRLLADEGQIGIGEGVQSGRRVRPAAATAARARTVASAIPVPATAARKVRRLPK